MSSLEANVGLLVALSDLKLVRLLRRAMQDDDCGKGQAVSGLGPAPTRIEPRFVHHPDPVIEPRKRIEPTPRFEPRKVLHPQPRLEVELNESRRPVGETAPAEHDNYKLATPSPIQPPWRATPWKEELPVEPRIVKVVRYKPDSPHKGTMLDMFL